ncbi:hypothetical protein VQ643_10605 [Pseudomonas sp. F1_0610]|uniref:hypothetical protein n=1 Tax=Pseudomonas sp. F1_0610 TaxID=3114284 RepID=UPI0039C3EF19
MTEHDFRYNLLNPQHTLTECRALSPGQYQLTGIGGSIQKGDQVLVTLKGSKDLSMRLTVSKVRHLINPSNQWVAVATGPAFKELAIHTWQVTCDGCAVLLNLEFAVDASLGKKALSPAAEARLMELGWQNRHDRHLCRQCQQQEA